LQSSSGPSSGAPIQIQFEGKNLNDLIAAADRGGQLLATFPHVTNITTSTQSNGSEFDLTIDRAKAAAFGLSTQTVAQTLRAAINGTKATTITMPSQNIDVVVKLDLNSANTDPNATTQATIDDVKNISIQGPTQSVLLGSILNDSLEASNADIAHNDQNRIETVSAYPDSKTTTSAVVAEFQKHLGEMHLPAGVAVSYGGETQSVNQSFTQMFIAIIAGLVLMFVSSWPSTRSATVCISYRSFRFHSSVFSTALQRRGSRSRSRHSWVSLGSAASSSTTRSFLWTR